MVLISFQTVFNIKQQIIKSNLTEIVYNNHKIKFVAITSAQIESNQSNSNQITSHQIESEQINPVRNQTAFDSTTSHNWKSKLFRLLQCQQHCLGVARSPAAPAGLQSWSFDSGCSSYFGCLGHGRSYLLRSLALGWPSTCRNILWLASLRDPRRGQSWGLRGIQKGCEEGSGSIFCSNWQGDFHQHWKAPFLEICKTFMISPMLNKYLELSDLIFAPEGPPRVTLGDPFCMIVGAQIVISICASWHGSQWFSMFFYAGCSQNHEAKVLCNLLFLNDFQNDTSVKCCFHIYKKQVFGLALGHRESSNMLRNSGCVNMSTLSRGCFCWRLPQEVWQTLCLNRAAHSDLNMITCWLHRPLVNLYWIYSGLCVPFCVRLKCNLGALEQHLRSLMLVR